VLFDTGPLTLITEDHFPVRGPLPRFAALAAREGAELETAAAAIGLHEGTVIGGLTSEMDTGAAFDLAEATAALASQSGGIDPAIGAVQRGAEALELELAGLTGQVPNDFAPPQPPPPARPGDYQTGPPAERDGEPVI
jgi:hypothetical protein